MKFKLSLETKKRTYTMTVRSPLFHCCSRCGSKQVLVAQVKRGNAMLDLCWRCFLKDRAHLA